MSELAIILAATWQITLNFWPGLLLGLAAYVAFTQLEN